MKYLFVCGLDSETPIKTNWQRIKLLLFNNRNICFRRERAKQVGRGWSNMDHGEGLRLSEVRGFRIFQFKLDQGGLGLGHYQRW